MVTCGGTIKVIRNSPNSASRARKRYCVKAKPAMLATSRVSAVVLSAMNSEFQSARMKPLPTSVSRLISSAPPKSSLGGMLSTSLDSRVAALNIQ